MDEKKPRGEELLLQYIKEVLQEPSKARLDISALPKEQQSLGKELQSLATCMLEQKRRLESSACTDSLTGLGNRTAFDRYVQRLWENRMPCTVAFIDMDELKACNDHAGHGEGDHYIQLVASLLEGLCLENEHIFRIVGDEFVIISTWATEHDLEQRLRDARADFVEDMAKKVDYHCGFSYGCTHINEVTPDAYNNLLNNADQRMYQYKIHQKQLRDEQHKSLQATDVFAANYGRESRLFDALSMTMRNR